VRAKNSMSIFLRSGEFQVCRVGRLYLPGIWKTSIIFYEVLGKTNSKFLAYASFICSKAP
jgi:hypothetical protein